MADITVTVTDAQLVALRRLDRNKTAKQVLQTHVDTWLQPYVQELEAEDRTTILEAYKLASPIVRDQVRELLNLG